MNLFIRTFSMSGACNGCGYVMSECICKTLPVEWGHPHLSLAHKMHLFRGKISACGNYCHGTKTTDDHREEAILHRGKCKICERKFNKYEGIKPQ